ncbi:MAG: enoyl-CoA hydratase/isomerase family protein [Phycisphaerae bacterium]|jgi:methylglutaconyl-CoA hydratase
MPLATLDFADRIATLTLRRADARNALSVALLADLHTCVDQLFTRSGVSVCVMTGEGKSFCAGMDLKAVLDDAAKARELLHSLADLTLKIRRLPMVTLAKVNGAAIGGGCGLACVCDIAITHADSKMGYPEVDLGVCPAVVAPWLVKKIGAGRARRALLTGGLMSGQEAHAIGIADHLVATAADLDPAATELATRLAQGGPHALRTTKELLNTIDGSTDATLVKRGADLSADVLQTPQTQAALRSKMSK